MAAAIPTLAPYGATQGYIDVTEDETVITVTQVLNTESMDGFEISKVEVYGDGQFMTVTFTKKHPSA